MPRSAADATRFTATGPYVSSKGFLYSPTGSGGPDGETPLEKVARLRAAKEKAQLEKITTFDRVVMQGRVVADKLHKFTALSLIGLTVLCGGITVFAIADMIVVARKKKLEFFENQLRLVNEARDAVIAGTATEEQIALYERERPEPIKPKVGTFTRAKEWLFSGLKKGDEEGAISSSGKSVLQSVQDRKPTSESVKATILPASSKDASKTAESASSNLLRENGGYLDLLANGKLGRK